MNFTQNDRFNQVKELTLIVGIDISSEVHYALAFNLRGIRLGKVTPFDNSKKVSQSLRIGSRHYTGSSFSK